VPNCQIYDACTAATSRHVLLSCWLRPAQLQPPPINGASGKSALSCGGCVWSPPITTNAPSGFLSRCSPLMAHWKPCNTASFTTISGHHTVAILHTEDFTFAEKNHSKPLSNICCHTIGLGIAQPEPTHDGRVVQVRQNDKDLCKLHEEWEGILGVLCRLRGQCGPRC
jgi:hypothetical protein